MFQRAIPIRRIHIHVVNFDTVFARIAHDLRRRVEAHRLRIQERAGEHIGIAAFDPSRDINKDREGSGMAFGKAVSAETLDLRKTAFSIFLRIVLGDHSLNHFLFVMADRSRALERRH